MPVKQHQKPVVLVTAIGTATATTIVKELRKTGDFYIVGTDIFPSMEVATSIDVDEFYVAPSSVENEEAFLEFVLDLCKRNGVNYYFAVIDEEVASLSRNREPFELLGVRLCIPNAVAVQLCHDKVLFASWCEEHFADICINRVRSLEEARGARFPLFLKPTFGRASIGCRVVESYEELLAYVTQADMQKDVVLQEFVSGDVVTVDVVRSNQTGECKAIPRLELLRNGNGCGIAVELFDDWELIDLCCEIAEALEINGVVNMEFFKTPDGYKIIELNPRFSAGAVFSCMAGADLVLDAVRIADKRPLGHDEIRFRTHFAKRYEAYELD